MTQQALGEAKKAILRYLAGQERHPKRMIAAVHALAAGMPGELSRLCAAIVGEGHEPEQECRDAGECLDRYIALGNEAAARMPEVHQHVQSCERCAAHVQVLKEMSQHREDWLAFSRDLAARQPVEMLMLTEVFLPHRPAVRPADGAKTLAGVWESSLPAARSGRKPAQDMEGLGRQVGEWTRQPVDDLALEAVTIKGERKTPICLSMVLPAKAALIRTYVVPEYQIVEQKDIWHLHIELAPSSLAREVGVGVGKKGCATTASRPLTVERPVQFHLAPPTRATYWLHFDWRSADGTRQEHKSELRLLYAAG